MALCSFATDTNNKIIEQIKEQNNNIHTLECKFIRKKISKLFGHNETISEGILYYDSGNLLNMTYNNEDKELLLISGNDFIMKKGTKIKCIDTSDNKQMLHFRNVLLNSISGNIQNIADENNAEIRYTSIGGQHIFKIENKGFFNMINGFELYYNATTLIIDKIRIIITDSHYTDYQLIGENKINHIINKYIFDKNSL